METKTLFICSDDDSELDDATIEILIEQMRAEDHISSGEKYSVQHGTSVNDPRLLVEQINKLDPSNYQLALFMEDLGFCGAIDDTVVDELIKRVSALTIPAKLNTGQLIEDIIMDQELELSMDLLVKLGNYISELMSNVNLGDDYIMGRIYQFLGTSEFIANGMPITQQGDANDVNTLISNNLSHLDIEYFDILFHRVTALLYGVMKGSNTLIGTARDPSDNICRDCVTGKLTDTVSFLFIDTDDTSHHPKVLVINVDGRSDGIEINSYGEIYVCRHINHLFTGLQAASQTIADMDEF